MSSAQTVYNEITLDEPSVRTEFMSRFEPDILRFASYMEVAHSLLANYQQEIMEQQSLHHQLPTAFAQAALYMHTQSMRLYMTGHMIPSGNAFRQTLEAVAMMMLCSDRALPFARDFEEGRYSTNKAITHLQRNCHRWGVNKAAIQQLAASEQFCHHFSHVSKGTLAVMIRFADQRIFVGANFDEGKLESYQNDVGNRVNFAQLYPDVFTVVRKNLELPL
nr:hypothetical protein [Herbaspirillum sp. ASV7]